MTLALSVPPIPRLWQTANASSAATGSWSDSTTAWSAVTRTLESLRSSIPRNGRLQALDRLNATKDFVRGRTLIDKALPTGSLSLLTT